MDASRQCVLGIDAGGTYTDAVLTRADGGRPPRWSKALTTYPDPSGGILESVSALGSDLSHVTRVCLSTTLATNALVEGLGATVGLLLLGFTRHLFETGEYASRLPSGPRDFVAGQMSAAGEELEPLDEAALREVVARRAAEGGAWAVCGIFAVRNPEHELRARQIIGEFSDRPVVCGHLISDKLDAVARAATCALNARLLPGVHSFLAAIRPALGQLGLLETAPIYLVRGDGSLMTEELSRARPLETFFSGPASSAIGAAHLAGVRRAVVVDVGGTTSDVILLADGEVVESPEGALIAGLRTHIPGLHGTTMGLGGDSHLRVEPDASLSIGPRRVVPVSLAVMELGLDRRAVAARVGWGLGGLPDFLRATGPAPPGLTDTERQVVDLVAPGPMSVEEIARRIGLASPTLLPIRRLLACRAVWPIAPTPTDVLAASGRITHLDTASAVAVTKRLASAAGTSLEGLADSVVTAVGRRLAHAVGGTCLARSAHAHIWDRGADVCLLPDTEMPEEPFLRLVPLLGPPIVGLGAPAACFVPEAARLLGTDCLVPEGAEVGGAIGAAVARVRRTATVVVRPVYAVEGIAHYGVHGRSRPELFETKESALARARELATEYALEDAGEPGLQVRLETTESAGRDAGGSRLVVEIAGRAVAHLTGGREED